MDKYDEYFNRAKDKLRFTGVGGVSLPNPDMTPNPVEPIKTDPNRQIVVNKGWVMVGGKTIKQYSNPNSPIQILDVSSKILEQRKTDASQKNNQNNNSSNK